MLGRDPDISAGGRAAWDGFTPQVTRGAHQHIHAVKRRERETSRKKTFNVNISTGRRTKQNSRPKKSKDNERREDRGNQCSMCKVSMDWRAGLTRRFSTMDDAHGERASCAEEKKSEQPASWTCACTYVAPLPGSKDWCWLTLV